MSCCSLNKLGVVCGLPLSNDKWCDYHAKRMIKYYKTYKNLETTIPEFNKIDDYDREQLINLNQKLIKIYHYRTTLRQQGYPDYQDEGHQLRIENTLKMIEVVSNKLVNLKTDVVFNGDFGDVRTRLAQATSTKQQKQKKIKKSGAKILSKRENLAKIEDITTEICERLVEEHMFSLFNLLSIYFIDKFGIEKGIKMMTVSLDCAVGIFMVLHTTNWEWKNNEQYRKVQVVSVVNNSDKVGKSYRCGYNSYMKMLEKSISITDKIPEMNFDSRYTLYFYIIHIVIKSYNIDIYKLADKYEDLVFSHDFDYDDNADQPVFYRQMLLDSYVAGVRSVGKISNRVLRLINEKQKLIDNIGRFYKPFPQLDIGFCMKLVWSGNMVDWKLVCLPNNEFMFSSPLMADTGKINLSNVKTLKEFYHVCFVLGSRVHQIYMDMYNTETFDRTTMQLVFERLLIGSNNISMPIRKDPGSPFKFGIAGI